MKSSSRLNYLILIAFVLAAIAFLIYRYVAFAEEQAKIYGMVVPSGAVMPFWVLKGSGIGGARLGTCNHTGLAHQYLENPSLANPGCFETVSPCCGVVETWHWMTPGFLLILKVRVGEWLVVRKGQAGLSSVTSSTVGVRPVTTVTSESPSGLQMILARRSHAALDIMKHGYLSEMVSTAHLAIS
jgi:hypothetical protein